MYDEKRFYETGLLVYVLSLLMSGCVLDGAMTFNTKALHLTTIGTTTLS
jgi:hypothetical protein